MKRRIFTHMLAVAVGIAVSLLWPYLFGSSPNGLADLERHLSVGSPTERQKAVVDLLELSEGRMVLRDYLTVSPADPKDKDVRSVVFDGALEYSQQCTFLPDFGMGAIQPYDAQFRRQCLFAVDEVFQFHIYNTLLPIVNTLHLESDSEIMELKVKLICRYIHEDSAPVLTLVEQDGVHAVQERLVSAVKLLLRSDD